MITPSIERIGMGVWWEGPTAAAAALAAGALFLAGSGDMDGAAAWVAIGGAYALLAFRAKRRADALVARALAADLAEGRAVDEIAEAA